VITRDILGFMEESKEDLEVKRMIEEAKAAGPKYWHSRTPQERLRALELMRQEAYGYDPATARLQRVIEFVKLKDDR
jgi:acyl-CoA reductase-like NAD-dependent aldehyde dehydrogenase